MLGSYRRARGSQGVIAWLMATEVCPWTNRYLHPLKEPIGWFLLATVSSVLIGWYANPLGWVMAASLLAIVGVGCVWPWAAVRMTACRLRPAVAEIHEGQRCELVFSVRNRWPLPVWGLAVEGYLDAIGDVRQPTLALRCVPPCSNADYRIAVDPQWRGRWPAVVPQIACSFPFGLWTARRNLHGCQPLTVWPRVLKVLDQQELAGGRAAAAGEGFRSGPAGEPLGVRGFRQGDRLRNVHWVHTARTDRLIVCERSGPERQWVQLVLDAAPSGGERLAGCQEIAWRVRSRGELGRSSPLPARAAVRVHWQPQASDSAGAGRSSGVTHGVGGRAARG